MSFRLAKRDLGALGLLVVVLAACGPSSEPEAVVMGDPGSTPMDRPPTSGGLEVLVQPDEDPLRPGYFDFGEVPFGDFLNHTFVLQNMDPRTVILQKVDPGCGCTVARLGKRKADGSLEPALSDRPNELLRLEPGEIFEVALRVDTTAVGTTNLDKLFMVRLASDSVTRPFVTLECHLVVRERFQIAPKSLNLGAIPINAGKEGQVTIKALGPDLYDIVGLGELPQGVVARLEKSAIGGQDGKIWVLYAGFLAPLDKGRLAAVIPLKTQAPDGTPGADVEVTMAGSGVDDVTVTPSRLILRPGLASSGSSDPEVKSAQVDAELISHLLGHRFRVTGYSIAGDEADQLRLIATPYLPASDGSSGQWTLTLETRGTPIRAQFTGSITLELDDPQYPQIEIPYAGLGF